MLDSDAVVAVLTAVGGSEAEHRAADRILEVHHLLGSSIGGVPHALSPTQRSEQIEIEGERPSNVGDRKIDVVYSPRWHLALLRRPGGFESLREILTPLEVRERMRRRPDQ
jgi:hypothetical protein